MGERGLPTTQTWTDTRDEGHSAHAMTNPAAAATLASTVVCLDVSLERSCLFLGRGGGGGGGRGVRD